MFVACLSVPLVCARPSDSKLSSATTASKPADRSAGSGSTGSENDAREMSVRACTWTEHEHEFSQGYAGEVFRIFSLSEAKDKCSALGPQVCRAVTCDERLTECTVRGSWPLQRSHYIESVSYHQTTFVPAASCYQVHKLFPTISTTTPQLPPGAHRSKQMTVAEIVNDLRPEMPSKKMSLKGKIVDSVLVVGAAAAAAGVAGGVAAAVHHNNEEETTKAETAAPILSTTPVTAPSARTIEMFGKKPGAGAPGVEDRQNSSGASLPDPAWMLVISLALLGACVLTAGALYLLCCGRQKRSRSYSTSVANEPQEDSDEEVEEGSQARDSLAEPEMPLLPALPPLLPVAAPSVSLYAPTSGLAMPGYSYSLRSPQILR